MNLEMQVRDVTTTAREIVGIVAPYNETSYLTGDPNGERLRLGCFKKSISQRGARIPLVIGHHHDRAAVGLSTNFVEDSAGLTGTFKVRADAEGDKVLADVVDGYLQAMSVGFFPLPGASHRAADGAMEHTEAILKEVSLVVVGAYEGARVLAVRQITETPDLAWLQAKPPVDLSPYQTRYYPGR